jgi:hypothetical protein
MSDTFILYQFMSLSASGVRVLIFFVELLIAGVILARFRLDRAAIPIALGLVLCALVDMGYVISQLVQVVIPETISPDIFILTGKLLGGAGVLGSLLFTAGLIPLALATHPTEVPE